MKNLTVNEIAKFLEDFGFSVVEFAQERTTANNDYTGRTRIVIEPVPKEGKPE